MFLIPNTIYIGSKLCSSSQSSVLSSQHSLSTDRHHHPTSTKAPSSISKMHLTAPSPRSHPINALQSSYSNQSANMHSMAHQPNAMTAYNSSTPSKYDMALGSSPSSTSSSIHPHSANGGSYGHPHHAAITSSHHPPQSGFGGGGGGNNVKSENNMANYDYMNSCLQSGYFGSSFSSLGTPPGVHVASDIAGYHHQHNVIQAAKLMATS